MSQLTRKRVILAKTEVTYGIDPVPTGAANAIQVKSISPTPQETTLVSRDLVRPYLGNSESLAAAIYAKIDFEVELSGSGTAGTAPGYGALLRACALAETVTAGTSVVYAPVSGAFDSVTLYYNEDGVLHKLTGARGTVSLAFPLWGIPTLKFSFTGIYHDVVDAALPTPVFTPFKKPVPVNNTNTSGLSLLSYGSLSASDLTIDIANTVTYRGLIGGDESVIITDRKSAGSITFENTKVAAKDWWTAAKDADTGPFTITHGKTPGNIVEFDAPLTQITKPTPQDKDGVSMLQAGLVLIPSAGNDEFSITFK